MRTVAIVQARVAGTRLPGKVLMTLGGATVLEQVVRRVRRIEKLDDLLIATSTADADDAIVDEGARLGVPCYRGPEEDVLSRYVGAGDSRGAEAVVRVTADCPLLDPEVSGHVLARFLEEEPDYASNILRRTYPRGLDTEVVTTKCLRVADKEAWAHYERIHVTPFVYQHPDRFHLVSVEHHVDHSHHRWTLDTPEDMQFLTRVYQHLGSSEFSWAQVLDLVRARPELAQINAKVRQRPLEEG